MAQSQDPSISKKNVNIEKIRKTYPNAYQPWNETLDNKLKEDFAKGLGIADLVKIYGRNRGAIRSRLIKLGLIEKNNNKVNLFVDDKYQFEIGRFTKLLLKFWPKLSMKRMAQKMGIENPIFDKVHEIFSQIKRVELLPLQSGNRGFMLVLDSKTTFYFYQDGDHFIYDGFEMGEYEKGDVTIFDNIWK